MAFMPVTTYKFFLDLTRPWNTSVCGERQNKHAPSPKMQRPQQALKRRPDPPMFEPKVNTGEVKVPKVEIKKQEEEKKPVPLPPPVEPPLQGGHYELNARMTKMVEAELQDIMIKVWHELPDNPSDAAEALVVEKLRNQAGDDFRNVLGLNITKRLLNVHNPLYVKVQFSGKPEKVYLGEFLKKYNFTAFKRIEKTVNMFAAQVKTINDFDRICSAKDIRCGEIKVTVNPIYKFTKCPPNLVTSFYDREEEASDETAETSAKEEKLEEKSEIMSSGKVMAENVPSKSKAEDSKSENVTKVEKLVSRPVENKTVVSEPVTENKPTAEKPESKPAVENKAATKPIIANKIVNKAAVENKTAVSKPTVENKTTVNKPAVVNKTAANKTPVKPAVVNKTAANKTPVKPAVVNKTAANKTPVKPAVEKPALKKPTPEKSATKPTVQNNSVTNPSVPTAKPTAENKTVVNKTAVITKTADFTKPAVVKEPAANKVAAKPPVQNKPRVTPKKNVPVKKPAPSPVKTPIKIDVKPDKTNNVNDYDELDDHDILALMSEGIVLDECSGSDDD